MLINTQIEGQNLRIDTDNPIDLAIPLTFNGAQPNIFGAQSAVSHAVEAGTMVGDTRRGGSCNFEQYTFIPHCNGTHTESVGHITNERISVLGSLKDVFIPAILVTIEPEDAADSGESYSCGFEDEDKLITKKAISQALKKATAAGTQNSALIIRTLPNDTGKLSRDYSAEPAPFFSHEAIHYIVEIGVKHLLVDIPSIDRMYDEGKLSNHRIFWNVAPGSNEINEHSRTDRTVTEMIYVPETAADSLYLLNLQIPAFETDAAPSRPVIFPVTKIS